MSYEELEQIVNFLLTFLVIAFIASSYMFIVNLWHAHASRSWPSVDSVIRSAEVRRVDVVTEYSAGTVYEAKVCFDFVVNGTMHTSDSISIITTAYNAFSKEIDAMIYIEPFPIGKPVKVYYDPKNPLFGVLKPGFSEDFLKYRKKALWRMAVLAVGILASMTFKSYSGAL